ncbi:LPXTG cell wall anchor domain-containing protein [Leifsonia poae]|uniref:LPXTG cell wall anchor domain-containing protein n=1 Tax=Leifsonia poae TaxID=110933 RepID=UPI003D670D4D
MRPTLRTALGWAAALLLNIGALTFIAGLVLPRTGSSGSAVLFTGIGLCAVGLAAGAGWMFASRAPHP